MLSVLVFDRMHLGERGTGTASPPRLGALSFDTDRSVKELGWSAEEGSASNLREQVVAVSLEWWSITTKVLR
jgi:hypothetical protein